MRTIYLYLIFHTRYPLLAIVNRPGRIDEVNDMVVVFVRGKDKGE